MRNWTGIKVPAGKRYAWDDEVHLREEPALLRRHDDDAGAAERHPRRARARAARRLGHDRSHLAGRQHRQDQPRGDDISIEQGVQPVDFNSYGARRGNHEVMMRGTFANIRLRNLLVPGHRRRRHRAPARAASRCRSTTPRCATSRRARRSSSSPGREYGTGSSRDWAAKGTMLLGVKAVIAESFERIHRSNLIGMGVLPLQFHAGRERAVARASPARRSSRSPASTARRCEGGHGDGDAAGRQADRRSRRACASIRRRSASTSATAASCSTCCGSWRPGTRRPRTG